MRHRSQKSVRFLQLTDQENQMAYILSSDRIRFKLEPDKGLWQVQTSCQGELSLKCIQSGVVLQGHGRAVFSPESLTEVYQDGSGCL